MFKQPPPKIQTTTLWDFPSQHYGQIEQGDSDYIGATPSYLIWNLMQRYTRPGDKVLDPMCGSGTTLDVCKDLDRRGVGFDVSPSRPDIQQADARKIPLDDESIDFAFIDPPYSTHIKYSGRPECIGELDARGGGYYEAMEEVIASIYRVLKDGAYFALYVSDSQAKGKAFCPIGFELFFRMSRLFEPVDIIAVTRHNKSMKRNHWHTAAIEGNFFLRGFNYLFVMRKNKLGQAALHQHDDVGMLSPLFQAATLALPGEVVSPDRFAELLTEAPEKLENQLSNKQKKRLGLRAPAPRESQGIKPEAKAIAPVEGKRPVADRHLDKGKKKSQGRPRPKASPKKPQGRSPIVARGSSAPKKS